MNDEQIANWRKVLAEGKTVKPPEPHPLLAEIQKEAQAISAELLKLIDEIETETETSWKVETNGNLLHLVPQVLP